MREIQAGYIKTAPLYTVPNSAAAWSPFAMNITDTADGVSLENDGSTNGAVATHTLPQTMDFTGALVAVRYKFAAGAPDEGLDNVAIVLREGSNQRTLAVWDDDGRANGNTLDGEWYEVWVSVNSLWSGTIDLSAVTSLRVIVRKFTDGAGEATIGQISIYPPITHRKPRLAITFDDGRDSQMTILEAMAAQGLPATLYIITNYVGNTGYFTLSQLQELQAMGHLIANHTTAHGYWTTDGMSEAQKRAQINDAAAWLEDNGFARGARHVALPGGTGQFGPSAESVAIAEDTTRSLRLTSSHINQFHPYSATRFLWTRGADNAVAATASASFCVDQQVDAVVLFHSGEESGIADFVTAVAALRDAGSLDVVTIDRLLPASPPRAARLSLGLGLGL